MRRPNKNKTVQQKSKTTSIAAATKQRKDKEKRRRIVQNKIKFCKSCPQSYPTSAERRSKTRVCHKTKTSLQAIYNDRNFKCPLNNF